MRIAVLETNTDDSAFARAHPRDGDKWQGLLGPLRPTWEFTFYNVAKGHFPPKQSRFDGWIIGGSPASVHDKDMWVGQLLALIQRLVASGESVFGACFGHQAIAQALGGEVANNPGGWALGLAEVAGAKGVTRQYAAHTEQVSVLPEGAHVMASSLHCPVAGFAIGQHVLTTQYHPEMTHGFIVALVEHLAHTLPKDVIARARKELQGFADTDAAAQQIVAFFEANAGDPTKVIAKT